MGNQKRASEHAREIYTAFRSWPDGKECFSILVAFMDGDRDNDLLQSMKEVDQKNFPEKYASPDGKKKKKRGMEDNPISINQH